jgi:tRNA 2-thiouridine synthesizing protein A
MSRAADQTDIETAPSPDDDSRPLRDLLRIAGRPCAGCGGRCSAHEAVWSIALGFRNTPRCLPCLAGSLGRDAAELRAQVSEYVNRHECYRRAWREADRLEAAGPRPAPAAPEVADTAAVPTDLTWDAGDMACGELVLALRVRLAKLPAGVVLTVRATDPGAPEDIPAWCRLTGHPLVSADHPTYLIRRKGD